MKLSIPQLTLIAIAVTSFGMQSASAQEGGRGARFNYAPNVWKSEQARIPTDNYVEPAHNVRSGAVPKGNLLGIDPSMLQKPQPIFIPPQVAARPATTTATPQMFIPKTSFNPAFGKPQQALAQLPILPQQAVSKPMTMPVQPAAARIAPAQRRSSASNLAGRLLKQPRRVTSPMQASPSVASYGKNVGYIPGPFLPSQGSAGMSSSAEVRGKVIQHAHK